MKRISIACTLFLATAAAACSADSHAAPDSATASTDALLADEAGAHSEVGHESSSPASQAAPPLTDYVDKYPFDEIAGVTFFDHPTVRGAVMAVTPAADIREWLFDPDAGPSQAIFQKDGAVVSIGCQQNACERRSWAIVIDTLTNAARVCYEQDGVTRWFSAGGVETVAGDCPLGEEDIDG